MLVVPIYYLPKNQSFCNSCSLLLEPIVCSTLYLPLCLDIICTDTILDLFDFLRKNMPKNTNWTPISKSTLSKIKPFRACFLKSAENRMYCFVLCITKQKPYQPIFFLVVAYQIMYAVSTCNFIRKKNIRTR